ncbi:Homeodomain-like protein [Gloeophyllum trabeum ATCC 11539]|uniref:Homeodomain-like protein n=1 Tax=Gloeophyllum trabeum (strain ATCC 11539 / FP-39264 / Madison 617) TaxID=670483 RepID=S7QKY0_GLOTA|nr:Homeodomain-like protein [Gloeophyllum trabeum ATCC 11539]EPQ59948.1 Homeodomain-like protein [Gloeophyllum trabeum ATCC 11539]
MGNRRYIPPEQKQLVITMSMSMKPREIAEVTKMGRSTVSRILALWRDTGEVERKPPDLGRPRALTSVEEMYLESLIERRPDTYLSELQDSLLDACGISVDQRTISRTLKRRGFTRKVVRSPS